MQLAFAYVASKNRIGWVNIFIPGKGWMSCDPGGNVTYDNDNIDKNFQQFLLDNLTVTIAPGDDNNPDATAFVFIPS